MAMIPCPKCGHQISDRASRCVHCGAPVEKYQKCVECGCKYPEKDKLCPNCGCPSTKKFTTFASEKEREVYLFLLTNTDKYPADRYEEVKSWLMSLNDRQFLLIEDMNYRDTTIMLLISIFLGYVGLDRFLLNDTKKGLMKLGMTCLSFLVIPGLISIIWWIKDIFNITELTKEYNYNLMKKVQDLGI